MTKYEREQQLAIEKFGHTYVRIESEKRLKLADTDVPIYKLTSGVTVISPYSIFLLLGRRSETGSGRTEYPPFMNAKNLRPYIKGELRKHMKHIPFIGKKGLVQPGFDVKILSLLFIMYMEAMENGALKLETQLRVAKRAERMYRELTAKYMSSINDDLIKGI